VNPFVEWKKCRSGRSRRRLSLQCTHPWLFGRRHYFVNPEQKTGLASATARRAANFLDDRGRGPRPAGEIAGVFLPTLHAPATADLGVLLSLLLQIGIILNACSAQGQANHRNSHHESERITRRDVFSTQAHHSLVAMCLGFHRALFVMLALVGGTHDLRSAAAT